MKLKYTFETMELDDQIVAIPVGNQANDLHGVIKMNETASFIFSLLKNEISEEAIVNAMTEEYDVSMQEASSDVKQYLEEFQRLGFL